MVEITASGYFDLALRDRFVLNDQAQKRLLTEAGLTAARALEIAQGIEAADRNTREWKSDPNLLSVHQDPCRHCGKSGHLSKECRYRECRCHTCGELGHISPVCKGNRKARKPGYQVRRKMGSGANYVHQEEPPEQSFPLLAVNNPHSTPVTVYVLVEGNPCLL